MPILSVCDDRTKLRCDSSLSQATPPLVGFHRSEVKSSQQYVLYGQQVRSEIDLPIPATTVPGNTASLEFRRADGTPELDGEPVAVRRGPGGVVLSARYQDERGEWIQHSGMGVFHISPDMQYVDVYPEPEVSDELLGLVLVGQISTFVLAKRGYHCLHASAITAAGRTAVFVGTNGQGKSTMAGCFLARGATLLTDDALPLRVEEDAVYGGPGLPMMKMWGDTAANLAPMEELPSLPLLTKKLLVLNGRFPFAEAPAKLDGLFALSRYRPAAGDTPEISLVRMSPRESLTLLLAQTSWNMLMNREEAARLLPVYARVAQTLPVWSLRYPEGYEHQDAVYRRILKELSPA